MAHVTIDVPQELLKPLAERAGAAGYSGPGPYLLAKLLEELGVPVLSREQIDAMLIEAIDFGPSELITQEVWDKIRREVEARLLRDREDQGEPAP